MKKLLILIAIVFLIGCDSKVEPQTYSKSDRLYWLANIWKDVSNNFFDPERLVKINWDSTYVSYIPLVEKADNDADYFRLLQRFMATVQDGHTGLVTPDRETHLPLLIEYIGGKYYIVSWEKAAHKDLKLPQEIISVDGIEFEKYLEKTIFPYIGASTIQAKRQQTQFYFRIKGANENNQVKLEMKGQDGKLNTIVVPYLSEAEVNSKYYESIKSPIQRGYNQYIQKDKYGTDFFRFDIRSFADINITPIIQRAKQEVEKAKYIIVDLRWNGGGNELTGDSLLMSFLDIDTLKTYRSQHRINDGMKTAYGYGFVPEYKDYYENRSLEISPEHKMAKQGSGLPTFKQPLYVLTSPRTCSAAEDFLITLRINYPDRAIIFGTPTFGSTGMPLIRQMPGNFWYRVCCRGVIASFDFYTEGIVPDVIHETAIEEYISGIDEIYNVVADYYKQNNKK